MLAEPDNVGTLSSPPSAAVTKLIGTSHRRSSSSRSKISCGCTCNTTYKSPLLPPRTPASPLPAQRNRVPVLTPSGTLSGIFDFFSTRPLPRQSLQGFSSIVPCPSHSGQVCCIRKKPRCVITWPRPPQIAQVFRPEPFFAPEPSHVAQTSNLVIEIFFSQPSTASSNLISMS